MRLWTNYLTYHAFTFYAQPRTSGYDALTDFCQYVLESQTRMLALPLGSPHLI
jgi:hypothetical protein